MTPRTIHIHGVPLDLGGGRRGVDMGPSALRIAGLAERLGHRPGMLSGGEQQRVAVSRALVMQPSLLLADEPTGNLDSATSHEVMEIFANLCAKRGITIVVITHERDIAAYGTSTIDFKDGLIVSDRVNERRAVVNQ